MCLLLSRRVRIAFKKFISLGQSMYNAQPRLLRADVLELLVRVQEVVGVGLWRLLSYVWLLDEVLVSLLLSKGDSCLPAVELDGGSLHEIGG